MGPIGLALNRHEVPLAHEPVHGGRRAVARGLVESALAGRRVGLAGGQGQDAPERVGAHVAHPDLVPDDEVPDHHAAPRLFPYAAAVSRIQQEQPPHQGQEQVGIPGTEVEAERHVGMARGIFRAAQVNPPERFAVLPLPRLGRHQVHLAPKLLLASDPGDQRDQAVAADQDLQVAGVVAGLFLPQHVAGGRVHHGQPVADHLDHLALVHQDHAVGERAVGPCLPVVALLRPARPVGLAAHHRLVIHALDGAGPEVPGGQGNVVLGREVVGVAPSARRDEGVGIGQAVPAPAVGQDGPVPQQHAAVDVSCPEVQPLEVRGDLGPPAPEQVGRVDLHRDAVGGAQPADQVHPERAVDPADGVRRADHQVLRHRVLRRVVGVVAPRVHLLGRRLDGLGPLAIFLQIRRALVAENAVDLRRRRRAIAQGVQIGCQQVHEPIIVRQRRSRPDHAHRRQTVELLVEDVPAGLHRRLVGQRQAVHEHLAVMGQADLQHAVRRADVDGQACRDARLLDDLLRRRRPGRQARGPAD